MVICAANRAAMQGRGSSFFSALLQLILCHTKELEVAMEKKKKKKAKQGYVQVKVGITETAGDELPRFSIPRSYLRNPWFMDLLEADKGEYRSRSREEEDHLRWSVSEFLNARWLVEQDEHITAYLSQPSFRPSRRPRQSSLTFFFSLFTPGCGSPRLD
ncbi:uncharacterized protein LOC144714571 [Wolffia australiana]